MKNVVSNTENGQANTLKRKNPIIKKVKQTVVPDEDIIRARAEEIYLKRVENGEDGTAESDWYAAIGTFKSR
jgi:hypothetical protein